MTVVANVGDLHLYNRNIRSTLLMPEASLQMLTQLHSEVMNHTEIGILNLMGDIQHLTPQGKNAIKQMQLWKNEFIKIEQTMRSRLSESGLTLCVDRNGHDITQDILNGYKPALFTIKGNHDFDAEVDYTFYDYLVEENVVTEPLYMIVDGVQFNYHHYEEADRPIERHADARAVVGLYHDNIDYPEMPFWMGHLGGYQAVNVFNGVDMAIIAHIHKPYEPVWIETSNGGRCLVYVQGSMGRTQFTDGQIRDEGFVSAVNTQCLEEVGTLQIPLIPKEQFFNYNQAITEQTQRRDFSQFSLNVGEIEAHTADVRDEIRSLNIEEEVKALGIQYLTEVLER